MAGWNDHQKKVVARILSDAQWLIDHEQLESYDSSRPYGRVPRRSSSRFGNDCTGTVKLVVCDWNGVPTFDGQPSGYGNTETFANGRRVYHVAGGPDKWQPLDIVLYKRHYGPFRGGADEHATMLMEKDGGVWQAFSMGSSPGPHKRPWNYRPDAAMVIRFPIPRK